MTFNRKIRILPPIAAREPISRFYNRKGYIKPLRYDPSLQASAESYGSNIRWSLGGWSEDNQDIALMPDQKQMDEWLVAIRNNPTAEREGYSLSQIRSNDYLATDGMGGVIRLPGVLSKLRAETIERILSDSREQITQQLSTILTYEDGEITEGSLAFYGAIIATAKVDEPLHEHAYKMLRFRETRASIQEEIDTLIERQREIALEQLENPSEENEREIARLQQRVTGLEAEFSTFGAAAFPNLGKSFQFGTMYLFAGLGTEIYQDRVALYNAVKSVLGEEYILNLLKTSPKSKKTVYDFVKFTVETPYVTRLETHAFLDLDEGPPRAIGFSQINPEYLFYDKNYEKTVSGSNIPENVQPSMYIYDLFTSAIIDNDGLRLSPAWQGNPVAGNTLQKEYAVSATLEGNIPENQNLLNDTSLRDYLDVYSHKATCDLTAEQKITIDRSLKSVMFPATEIGILKKLEEKKKFFPMYIQPSFATSDQGDVGKIIEENKVSSAVLESLRASEGAEQSYQVFTDYVVTNEDGNGFSISTTNLGTKPFRSTSIFEALEFGMNDEVIESLVVSEKGIEPITRFRLTNSQKENLQRALLNSRSTIKPKVLNYFNYLGKDTESPSESLGYRLSKYNQEGTKIQDILFANTGESQTITYVDTQVKYDTKYRYELSEFRLVVGTQCEVLVIDADEPLSLLTNDPQEIPNTMNPALVTYDIRSYEKPVVQVLEVPIYGTFFEDPQDPRVARCISYPIVNIMSHPPCAPDIQVLPLLDNFRQIKINTQLGTGNYTGDHALEFINVGQNAEKIQALYQYQRQFENYDLRPGHLEYKNEGIEEIQKVILLRARALDFTVPSYNDLYASFASGGIRTLSLDPEENVETVVSFDVLDTLETNTYYYYTCYVEDNHGNPSLPAPIYRVRLVYEKGLFIPEIELFQYTPISTQMPTRRFARFMRVEASDIQTFPFFDLDSEGVIQGTKNLASVHGSPVVGNTFVFRLTSRDTGRKFDIKLTFDEKAPEEEDENTLCND
tara:strand:- start:5750 stop:8803 length:3054 start_codon:yes stop_codon:yes gene_type:complete